MLSQWIFDNLSVLLRKTYAGIETPPVLDMETYFPEGRILRQDYEALKKEALHLFQNSANIPLFHEISSTQHRISDNDGKKWKMVLVKAYGHEIKHNSAQIPTLTRFLRENPTVTTASISFLDPGKHIPAHRGPFRGILRYHICLYAPDAQSKNGPWLRVADETEYYREGADLLWDDTFEHEVLNPGPNPRIAILLDVKRPVKSLFHRLLFRLVLTGGWIYSVINERHMRIGE